MSDEDKCQFIFRDDDGYEHCRQPPIEDVNIFDDGETLAETKRFCALHAKSVREQVSKRTELFKNSIIINSAGERIKQSWEFKPGFELSERQSLWHHRCGEIEIKQISHTHFCLHCANCNLRLLVPTQYKEWEKTREFFSMVARGLAKS